jgi:hypothetical protein
VRPPEQLGQHRGRLRLVGADAVLAEQDQIDRALARHGGQRLGPGQPVRAVEAVVLHQHRAVRTHGQTLAQRRLGALGAGAGQEHLALTGLADLQGLLQRILVVG